MAEPSSATLDTRLLGVLLAHGKELLALFTSELRVLYMSPSVGEMLGYTTEELQGRPSTDFVCEEDHPLLATVHQRLVAQAGAVVTATFRLRAKNGALRWVEMTAANRLDVPGIGAIVASIHDVTQHRRVAASLQSSEDRISGLVSEQADVASLLRERHDLANAVSRAESVHQIASLTVEAARRIGGVDVAGVYLFEAKSGALLLESASGASSDFVLASTRYEETAPQVLWVRSLDAAHGRSAAIPVAGYDNALLQRDGIKSLSVVLLRHREHLMGCINVASRSFERLPAAVNDALEAIAAVSAEALAGAAAEALASESAERHVTERRG